MITALFLSRFMPHIKLSFFYCWQESLDSEPFNMVPFVQMGFVHPLCSVMSKFQGNNILTICLMIKKTIIYFRCISPLHKCDIYIFLLPSSWNKRRLKNLKAKDLFLTFPNIFQEKANGNTSYTKEVNKKRHWRLGKRGQQVPSNSAELGGS